MQNYLFLSYFRGFNNSSRVHFNEQYLCVFADEFKSELGQQLSLIAGSLVGGVCIVSLVAIAIICTR